MTPPDTRVCWRLYYANGNKEIRKLISMVWWYDGTPSDVRVRRLFFSLFLFERLTIISYSWVVHMRCGIFHRISTMKSAFILLQSINQHSTKLKSGLQATTYNIFATKLEILSRGWIWRDEQVENTVTADTSRKRQRAVLLSPTLTILQIEEELYH